MFHEMSYSFLPAVLVSLGFGGLAPAIAVTFSLLVRLGLTTVLRAVKLSMLACLMAITWCALPDIGFRLLCLSRGTDLILRKRGLLSLSLLGIRRRGSIGGGRDLIPLPRASCSRQNLNKAWRECLVQYLYAKAFGIGLLAKSRNRLANETINWI